jgi:rare lipoprotein A
MKSFLLPGALLIALQVPVSGPAAANGVKADGRAVHSRSYRVSHKAHRTLRSGSSGQTGVASYYSKPQRLASGGHFNPGAMTAAHKTLPFGTRVRVTHTGNGRSVDVRINDRGPFIAGRIIDLSKAAAQVLGMRGTARVKTTVLGRY